MASARPTLVTAIGDISKFLKDNASAFIPKSIQVNDVAEKMREALSNESLANDIGFEGFKIAQQYFSYIKESKKITDYISNKQISSE